MHKSEKRRKRVVLTLEDKLGVVQDREAGKKHSFLPKQRLLIFLPSIQEYQLKQLLTNTTLELQLCQKYVNDGSKSSKR